MTERPARALVVGEVLVDIVHRADRTDEHPGGSPANVAIGLGRLGRPVDLLTWFGPDDRGRQITGHLHASGVDVVPGSGSAPRTSVAAATLDADGGARYDFDLTWQLPATPVPEPAPLVVHTGSIAAVLEPGGRRVRDLVDRVHTTSTVTYDPNIRPSLMPEVGRTAPIVDSMVARSDVVKVSQEDLEWLDAQPFGLARRWARTGPAVVIVTHAGEGATAFCRAGELSVSAPTVQVADTVGAGDSFMAGLIDGLWAAGLLGADRRGELHRIDLTTLQDVLERCARIAAITVSRPGADPPWRSEVD